MLKQSPSWIRYPLQVVNYTVFMALAWYFSVAPPFENLKQDEAVVVLALNHEGENIEPCHRLSPQELAALPPNMRKPVECGRERSPLIIEVLMDDKVLFNTKAIPPGLYRDGSANVFLRAEIAAGQHDFKVKMNDSVHKDGFNHQYQQKIELTPAQLMVIGFDKSDGFSFK